MITATVCVLAFASLIAEQRPAMDRATREWVAANVCAAAHDTQTDPRLLGAYILNENGAFDLWLVRPAGRGADHGLFQENSYYQRGRDALALAHHPYYGARIAAEIIHENLAQFGWSWQAFAAYWSRAEASHASPAARAYYQRLLAHYAKVAKVFARAESHTAQTHPLISSPPPHRR